LVAGIVVVNPMIAIKVRTSANPQPVILNISMAAPVKVPKISRWK